MKKTMKKTLLKNKLLIIGLSTMSIGQIALSAAGNPAEEASLKMVGTYSRANPGVVMAPLEQKSLLMLVNQTNCPIEVLYKVNDTNYLDQLAAAPAEDEKNRLIINSRKNLHPLIGIRTKSMLTGSTWIPATITSALGNIAYGNEFTPYNLRELIGLNTDADVRINYNRNKTITGFTLDLIPLAPQDAYKKAAEALYNNRNNVRIRNDSLNPMEVTYRTMSGYKESFTIPSGETRSLSDMSFINDQNITLKAQTAVLPTATSGYIYSEKTISVPYLQVKSSINPNRPLYEGITFGQHYDIVIPKMGGEYVELVK